ncbi:MFS transporter [Bifidobacterium aemilianum]|uniref:MFS transporter n=2 Tax=Bifidobacterium aemilianum TaxID=2493120 RepID=A0A366K7Z3_9BIFI|nr:MFS transporter [Bifidobacterium aemilianum]
MQNQQRQGREEHQRHSARKAGKPKHTLQIHFRRKRLKTTDVTVVPHDTLRQAISGTVVGNFMEWYDFGVYGYLAVTMTSVFTKGLPESMGLLVMLLGFAVSFLVRPLGGIVLGPLGDRVGRQKVLFFTMGMMAISTGLIGLLPTAAQIGPWAVLPLYFLKMMQGFSTGGEYAGATTYISEFSPDRKRGFYSAWLDLGSYLGSAFGAMTVAITTVVCDHIWGAGSMAAIGWRIPYLLTIPLGIIAILLRSRIPETPQFTNQLEQQEAEAAALEARGNGATQEQAKKDTPGSVPYLIHHHWRELLMAISIVAATNTAGYVLTSYMPTYLEEEVGTTPTMAAAASAPVLILMSLSLPLIGALSDRIGRKPVYAAAVASALIFMLPAFWLLHQGDFWAIQGALLLIAIPVACYAGVSASTLPALFPTSSRFGGMGLSYNLAVSLFGGTTPLVAQALIVLTGNHYMPAVYIMIFAALSGIAVWCMQESSKSPLLGSLPTVETKAEAIHLVKNQDDDPLIDTSTMPMPLVTMEVSVPEVKQPEETAAAGADGAAGTGTDAKAGAESNVSGDKPSADRQSNGKPSDDKTGGESAPQKASEQ